MPKMQSWSRKEDDYVRRAVATQGKCWTAIGASTGRTGKQVRERYLNVLDPALTTVSFQGDKIVRSDWSEAEDSLLAAAVMKHGRKFVDIKQLYYPHRGESDVKNRFTNSTFKHRLLLSPISASKSATAAESMDIAEGEGEEEDEDEDEDEGGGDMPSFSCDASRQGFSNTQLLSSSCWDISSDGGSGKSTSSLQLLASVSADMDTTEEGDSSKWYAFKLK